MWHSLLNSSRSATLARHQARRGRMRGGESSAEEREGRSHQKPRREIQPSQVRGGGRVLQAGRGHGHSSSQEVVSEDFTGPVALALSYGDVVAPAKILTDFIKGIETVKIRSAVVDGKKLNADAVRALAKMLGLKELRGQIAALINMPAARLA